MLPLRKAPPSIVSYWLERTADEARERVDLLRYTLERGAKVEAPPPIRDGDE